MGDHPGPTLGTQATEISLLRVRTGLVNDLKSPILSLQQAESVQEVGALAKDNDATPSCDPSTESSSLSSGWLGLSPNDTAHTREVKGQQCAAAELLCFDDYHLISLCMKNAAWDPLVCNSQSCLLHKCLRRP